MELEKSSSWYDSKDRKQRPPIDYYYWSCCWSAADCYSGIGCWLNWFFCRHFRLLDFRIIRRLESKINKSGFVFFKLFLKASFSTVLKIKKALAEVTPCLKYVVLARAFFLNRQPMQVMDGPISQRCWGLPRDPEVPGPTILIPDAGYGGPRRSNSTI